MYVDIEPQALEDFVTDLMRDLEMARLDFAFATVATGGGHGARLAPEPDCCSLAPWLLET